MKLIQAVVDPESIRRVQDELNRVEVFRLTVSDVEVHRIGEESSGEMRYEPVTAIRLEIAVNENFVRPTLDALYRALADSDRGDGERGPDAVYVLPLKDAIRIRTGERGPEAI